MRTITTRRSHDIVDVQVERFVEKAIELWSDADDATLTGMLGTHDATPPGHESERRDWIRRQTRRSFDHPSTSERYDLRGEFAAAVQATLRSPARLETLDRRGNLHVDAEAIATGVASRYATLVAVGMPLLRRIDAETEALVAAGDDAIARRFASSPAARLDRLPVERITRRHWINDMLVGENAMARTGGMSPAQARDVSRRIVCGVIIHDGPDPIVIDDVLHGETSHASRHADQAGHLQDQSDDQLRTRFRHLNGMESIEIPSAREDRIAWTLKALAAEHIARMTGGDAARRPASDWISIGLDDVRMTEGKNGITYVGSLTVDGQRICAVASVDDGSVTGRDWHNGCSQADLELLSLHVGATRPLRDMRPDSLEDVLLDLVTMRIATDAYAAASAHTVFFAIGTLNPEVLSVGIPDGGTREGAREHILAAHADAVPLDDLEESSAVLLWSTAYGASDAAPA